MSRRIRDYESHGAAPGGVGDEFASTDATRRERRPAEVEILLDDPRLCVVAKPAGMPTVPERFAREKTTVVDAVWALWRRADPSAAKPVLCHRLDRGTSGCLVLAKDREAARALLAAFRERTVRKSYVAIVLGAPQPPAGEVEFRVGPDRRRPGAMQVVGKGGKECRDAYETLEVFRGLSLVRVRPQTGRTHEVRLALRQLGAPCAIDPLYGSKEPILLSQWKRGYRTGRGRAELPLIDRLTLHAEAIEFPHPADGRPVRAVCPPPRDFAATLKQLRRHAAPGTL